jgi:hypothetical protein
MFKFWKKKAEEKSTSIPWTEPARQGIEQALQQTPVPAMLKGTIRKQLETAAEEAARTAGHAEVTVQDVMQGLLSKLPAGMREKVEQAAQQGPEGLKKLKDELKDK